MMSLNNLYQDSICSTSLPAMSGPQNNFVWETSRQSSPLELRVEVTRNPNTAFGSGIAIGTHQRMAKGQD